MLQQTNDSTLTSAVYQTGSPSHGTDGWHTSIHPLRNNQVKLLNVRLSVHIQLQHEAYWNFILQNFMKTCWATLILFVADNFNCLTRQPTWVYVCTCLFCTVTLRITCSVHTHYTSYHLNSVCQKWKSSLQQHCCTQLQWELHTDCSTAANVSRRVDTS